MPWLLLVFFASTYMLASPGVLNNPDAGTRLLTAIKLATTGSIEISDADFPNLDLSTYELGRNRRGLWVEVFNEGQSVVLAPFLAVLARLPASDPRHTAEFFAAAIFFPLTGALTPVALWVLLSRLSPSSSRANLAACLVLGLCTCSLVYAYNGQQEMQVALLLILLTQALMAHFQAFSARSLAAAGVCLGAILLFRYSSLPLVGVVLVWVARAYRRDGKTTRETGRALGLLALAALITYAPQFYWNWVKTGNPLELPIVLWNRGPASLLSGSPTEGLRTMLWSPSESVLLYNPILILSLLAIPLVWHDFRREPYLPLYAYALIMFSYLTCVIGWEAEIGWGPRLLAHLNFLMVLPAWLLLRARPTASVRLAVLAAALCGFGVQLLGTLYASEMDFSAIRTESNLYGRPTPEVCFLKYRAQDLSRLLSERRPFVPERFLRLPQPDKWFVPQWWWVRLWTHPEYGAGRLPVALVVTCLGLGVALSAAGLLRFYRVSEPGEQPAPT